MDDFPIVDPRHHLWDLERFSYPWLSARPLPASVAGDVAPIAKSYLLGFRFDRPLKPRELAHERVEIEELVTAFPAIEILNSRFRDYHGASVIDPAADFMSNSAFVVGAPREDWRSFDLARLEARLLVDGVELVRTVGGHAAGNALIPAIALANTLRHTTGIPAGHLVTTGTYTGLKFIEKNTADRGRPVGRPETRRSAIWRRPRA